MPAHGLRDTGHRKGKIRGQEYVVAACHMILAENRAWAGNSQPGTPQSPPPSPYICQPDPVSKRFHDLWTLPTAEDQLYKHEPVETIYHQTVNMPTQNVLGLFQPPKPVAKIVILSDFCPIP